MSAGGYFIISVETQITWISNLTGRKIETVFSSCFSKSSMNFSLYLSKVKWKWIKMAYTLDKKINVLFPLPKFYWFNFKAKIKEIPSILDVQHFFFFFVQHFWCLLNPENFWIVTEARKGDRRPRVKNRVGIRAEAKGRWI